MQVPVTLPRESALEDPVLACSRGGAALAGSLVGSGALRIRGLDGALGGRDVVHPGIEGLAEWSTSSDGAFGVITSSGQVTYLAAGDDRPTLVPDRFRPGPIALVESRTRAFVVGATADAKATSSASLTIVPVLAPG